ncbi:MAG: DUF2584 family protein [Phycisphaerae bacterium]|jgi:hypothetical protein
MGFPVEFNWALKLKYEQGLDEQNLKEDIEYSFTKGECRCYPVNIPIDLINDNWEAIAKVIITEFTIRKSVTIGKYKTLKIYSQSERDFLTKYWRETVQLIKGKKISSFSGLSVT